jgi:septal ring factor EnvC (AmiA/AmiB activator)
MRSHPKPDIRSRSMRAPLLILCLAVIALPVAAIARQTPSAGDVSRLQAEFRDERARALRLRAEAAEAAREIAGLESQLTALRTAVGQDDAVIADQRARLRELGVDWFYLFLDNTENRNWAPFATVEYQNSEVAILKLIDPSS